MKEIIIDFLNNNQIEYEEQTSMSGRTWIHRGPIVPFIVVPHNVDQLIDVVTFFQRNQFRYVVIGHTSNLYIKPSFVTDAFITTRKLTNFHDDEDSIICDPGVNIARLSQYAVEKGYDGFEGLVGLPGTVAGAVVNNSSCFNCSVSGLVSRIDALVINPNGSIEIKSLDSTMMSFKHRSSAIKRKELKAIVIRVALRKTKTNNKESLKKIARNNIETRKITQEGKAQNLGSIFSGYNPIPITLFCLGWTKFLKVLLFRVREHFCREKKWYQLKRNHYLLKLYGFSDIERYVSNKNINCFIWKDEGADAAFERYFIFMHLYAECDPLEIEILE